jgi:hypothetical protein
MTTDSLIQDDFANGQDQNNNKNRDQRGVLGERRLSSSFMSWLSVAPLAFNSRLT